MDPTQNRSFAANVLSLLAFKNLPDYKNSMVATLVSYLKPGHTKETDTISVIEYITLHYPKWPRLLVSLEYVLVVGLGYDALRRTLF